MPVDHQEKRDCGCVLLHRRVYVCEKHAAVPEKIRDQISEMVGQVMAKEVEASVALERERCAKYFEDGPHDKWEKWEIAKAIREWIR